MGKRRSRRSRRLVAALAVLGSGGLVFGSVVFVSGRGGDAAFRVFPATRPPGSYEPLAPPKLDAPAEVLQPFRAEAWSRAHVWRLPSLPIARVDFTRNVDPDFDPRQDVACQHRFDDSQGFTPKFDC